MAGGRRKRLDTILSVSLPLTCSYSAEVKSELLCCVLLQEQSEDWTKSPSHSFYYIFRKVRKKLGKSETAGAFFIPWKSRSGGRTSEKQERVHSIFRLWLMTSLSWIEERERKGWGGYFLNRIYAKRKGVVSPNKKRGFSSLSLESRYAVWRGERENSCSRRPIPAWRYFGLKIHPTRNLGRVLIKRGYCKRNRFLIFLHYSVKPGLYARHSFHPGRCPSWRVESKESPILFPHPSP